MFRGHGRDFVEPNLVNFESNPVGKTGLDFTAPTNSRTRSTFECMALITDSVPCLLLGCLDDLREDGNRDLDGWPDPSVVYAGIGTIQDTNRIGIR
eukprot:1253967-Rhodomonas_salina.4